MPKMWFQPAGLRSEPMKSLPSATGSNRSASATAAPPLLPPAERVGSQGLGVAPKSSLKVCEPRPNSGMLVLPTTMPPAALMRAVIRLSCAATASFSKALPSVEGKPAACDVSLIACGKPCIQPRDSPRARSASC